MSEAHTVERMEVLFITHKHPPAVGGMQKQSFELVSGVSKRIRTHTLVLGGPIALVAAALTLRARVDRILRENPGISLIHLNDALMAFIALPLLRRAMVPILATIHGLDIVMPGRWYQRRVVPRFRRLSGVIAVSSATARECLDRGFGKEQVFVVPNGVDPGLADIAPQPAFRTELEKRLGVSLAGKRLLVSVGRPVRRKGFSWFISEVVPLLDHDVVYLVIGPKSRHIAVQKRLLDLLPKRLGLQAALILGLPVDEPDVLAALEKPAVTGRAFFLGKLPFAEMVQTLKAADLFVMPNIRSEGDAEGFGLVALEAAACGLPVVASGIEGITDAVVDGENGFLLPPQAPQAWRDRIHALLADKEALRAFGRRASSYTLRNFSWEKMCDGYLAVFAEVCARASK